MLVRGTIISHIFQTVRRSSNRKRVVTRLISETLNTALNVRPVRFPFIDRRECARNAVTFDFRFSHAVPFKKKKKSSIHSLLCTNSRNAQLKHVCNRLYTNTFLFYVVPRVRRFRRGVSAPSKHVG